MRIAFVIGEVDSGAGQTRNLIEIIRTIQLYDKSWKITVFTHRYRDNVFPCIYQEGSQMHIAICI